MKTKHLILTLALMTVFGAAQAQKPQGITPQQMMERTHALPSEENLVLVDIYGGISSEDLGTLAPKVRAAKKEKQEFYDKIDALRQQAGEVVEAQEAAIESAGRQDADRIARRQTGRSAEQLENMSDKELEGMAGGMVQQRLGAAGLGNMSLADLQALEGKSDEEILKAMEGATPTQADAALKRITDRWAAIDREIDESIHGPDGTNKLYADMYEERRPELTEKLNILLPFQAGAGDQDSFDAGYEGALANYRAVCSSYLMACYRNWLAHVRWMQGRVEAKMADVAEYDRLTAQKMSATGMGGTARQMPSAGYDIAVQYLEITSQATAQSFRLPEAGDIHKEEQ
jgi:hypothetical protein